MRVSFLGTLPEYRNCRFKGRRLNRRPHKSALLSRLKGVSCYLAIVVASIASAGGPVGCIGEDGIDSSDKLFPENNMLNCDNNHINIQANVDDYGACTGDCVNVADVYFGDDLNSFHFRILNNEMKISDTTVSFVEKGVLNVKIFLLDNASEDVDDSFDYYLEKPGDTIANTLQLNFSVHRGKSTIWEEIYTYNICHPIDDNETGVTSCDSIQDHVSLKNCIELVSHYAGSEEAGENLKNMCWQGVDLTTAFTIRNHPDCQAVQVSLAVYEASQDYREQELSDFETACLGPGDHKFKVQVPDWYYQIDWVVGDVIEQFGKRDESGRRIRYRDRKIQWDKGGFERCD